MYQIRWYKDISYKRAVETMLATVRKQLCGRIVQASFWTIGGHGLSQIIRLGSNLIMTRLLVPEMFGVMAIATVLIVGLNLFSDIGLSQNIVQSKRGGDPVFLNTLWTMQIIRGMVIWLLALGVSGGLYVVHQNGWLSGDTVYADPVLPFVFAAISFSAVIAGFESTRLATSIRQLAQKRITLLEICSQLFGLVAMMAWVSVDRSIWALVAGWLASSAAKAVLSHVMLSGVSNRLGWDSVVFWEALHFGKWMFLSSIVGFLLSSGDRLILGAVISSEVLGFYSIAFLLMSALQLVVSKLSALIVFPALSEVYRERNEQFKSTYYKFRMWIDAGILFAVGFLVVAGGVIIDVLYDDRFAEAGHMLQVLSLVLVAQRYALADQCYLAMGKPKVMAFLIGVRMVALYCFVPAGYYFNGLDGALWGIVLSSFASVPQSLYMQVKYNLFDLKNELFTLPILVPGALFGWMAVSLIK